MLCSCLDLQAAGALRGCGCAPCSLGQLGIADVTRCLLMCVLLQDVWDGVHLLVGGRLELLVTPLIAALE